MVRDGLSPRRVARKCRVALSTVQRWVARVKDGPLDQVDWSDRPSGCRVSVGRTTRRVEKRTIGRILERGGALDGRRRVRHKAPPPGWYLPDLAAQRVEMDSFDAIEDLVIRGGHDVNVLTGISLHGGLSAAWPAERVTAKFTVQCLLSHWREFGLPAYAKFDNDTVFQGAHQWPDSFGRVTRLCLSLAVTPVFAPPLSRGFQADMARPLRIEIAGG